MTLPELNDLIAFAEGAGAILLEGVNQAHTVGYKGEIDLVTEMDRRSEDYLLDRIRTRFAGHEILAEESGLLNGHADHLWLVDPLDGTTNYAHGLPIYSVSIAYAYKGVVQLGVVFDPSRGECFWAARGEGAFLNGQPIRPAGATELIDALLVTGFPYNVAKVPDNLVHFNRFITRSQAVRRLGSAAIDICYVACGRLDGYWETKLGPWDIAAGGLIAEEAGAKITDLEGGPVYLKPPYASICANADLHAKMLAVLLEK